MNRVPCFQEKTSFANQLTATSKIRDGKIRGFLLRCAEGEARKKKREATMKGFPFLNPSQEKKVSGSSWRGQREENKTIFLGGATIRTEKRIDRRGEISLFLKITELSDC